MGRVDVRHRRVRTQIHLLDLHNIVLGVAAEIQRVIARNLQILVDNDLATAGNPRWGCRDRDRAQGSEDEGGELHDFFEPEEWVEGVKGCCGEEIEMGR